MAKSRADWIVGELTRKSGERPLVVLMTSTHPMTDRNLCKTGHQFYNLDLPQFPIKWQNEGGVPENMHIIHSLDELPCRPDIIISQNIVDQFSHWMNISRLFDCPVLCFEHTLPTQEWMAMDIPNKLKNDLALFERVFITDYSKSEWQCGELKNAHTIYHMIDTKKYDGWLGGNGRAAVVVNAFAGRQWAVGDVEGLLTLDGGKRIDLFGNNPGFKSQPLSQQQVISTLQDYDVFVNTSLRSPIPASLLEAAAVGIPIVTTATCAIPEFFKDGINCLTFSTFEECLSQVDRLLADKQLRKTIGQAGRATIIEKFNEQRYVADWNKVFQATKDSYNG